MRLIRSLLSIAALCLSCSPAHAVEVEFDGPEFQGAAVKLTGFYTLPEGSGPHPAAILMPSGSGTWSNDARWAERFNAWGFAALRVESLAPRGYEHMGPGVPIAMEDLAKDLAIAIDWLRARPAIDGSRVYVAGWSAGGGAALLRLSKLDPAVTPGAIAIYPPCQWIDPPSDAVPVPLLLLLGGADAWAPAASCAERYAAQIEKGLVTYVEYPEAGHLFDAESEATYRPADAADAIERVRGFVTGRKPKPPGKAR